MEIGFKQQQSNNIQLPDFKSLSNPSTFCLRTHHPPGLSNGKSEQCFGFKVTLSERPAKRAVINYSLSNRPSPRSESSSSTTTPRMVYSNLGPLSDRRINQSYVVGLSIGPEHNVRGYPRVERHINPYAPSPPRRHDVLTSNFDLLHSTHNSRVKETVSDVDVSMSTATGRKVRQQSSKIRAKSSKGRRGGRTPKPRDSARRRVRKLNKIPATCFPLQSTLKDYVDKNETFDHNKVGDSTRTQSSLQKESFTNSDNLINKGTLALPPKMHARGSPDVGSLPSRSFSRSHLAFSSLPSSKQYASATAPSNMRRSYNDRDTGTSHSRYLHASPSLNRQGNGHM